MRVLEMRPAPDLLHDLLTRHDLAGVLRPNLQNETFLRTEDKPLAVDRPGAGRQIDFKRAYPDHRIVRGSDARPQRYACPRDQFADTERFDDVVVRAELEQPDFLALARAHREHNDRNVRP